MAEPMVDSSSTAAPAPPQPPLPPPVVDGIESNTEPESTPIQSSTQISSSTENMDSIQTSSIDPDMQKSEQDENATLVRPVDLAAFAELISRFHTRVDKAAAGRKYRPLRTAWTNAAEEIARYPDRVNLNITAEKVITALRLGCESGRTVVVDACLDCAHRLFEYGHVGSNPPPTDIALPHPALDELVDIVCSCLEVKDDDVFLRMVQTLLTAATRTRSGLHQGSLLAAVRTIYNIFLNARTQGAKTTARVSLTQILNFVFARMEAETAEIIPEISPQLSSSENKETDEVSISTDTSGINIPQPALPDEEGGNSSKTASLLQKDAYLLFRALCKLSAKEDVESGPDTVGIRSKLLALELIRNLINNSGPAFRSGERFIYALRQYLAPSLLINCMWNSAEVMDVSFDIFETLLRKDTLRPLLKTEIGAVFDTVVFRFLESPTAGAMRKRRAITLLHRLSADRQTMADLFLNYDCDIESPKIFERIVSVISVAAQDLYNSENDATVAASTPGAGQVDARALALTAVTQVIRSLRNWSRPIEDAKESIGIAIVNSIDKNDEEPNQKQSNNSTPEKDSNGIEKDREDAESSEIKNHDSNLSKSAEKMLSKSRSNVPVVAMVSEGSDRDTTKFEEALKAKRDTAEGISIFNTKPKRGIEYLVKHGRLQENPEVIARFLHKAENLDAKMVGEYLGEGGAFNINVMHAYTDVHDFTKMTFDGALRQHLSGFRLPGEAQKIDRIMEKYASRFCECNPDVFANADAAYVLAYSAIMLHTDAHNDTIKNKMSKEEFIKNNRGINDGGDLPAAFLSGLYDRITTSEIRLSSTKKDSTVGADAKTTGGVAAMDSSQRGKQFEQESERLMAQTKVLFAKKRKPAQDYTYYSATNVHLARLMFETAWYPVLAAISLNLEEASPIENNIVALCLDGFRNGIAIGSTFGMDTAKDAFVSSLAKFTHLTTISEMRAKNVECVRMILAIAALEGNNLGEQWVVIVRAISQLEQIRAVASGNPEKYLLQKSPMTGIGSNIAEDSNQSSVSSEQTQFTSRRSSETKSSSTSSSRRSSGGRYSSDITLTKSASTQAIDSKAASMATTIPESEIERIFTNSFKLSASGVADFCKALCEVALQELSETPLPRIFCLQKIIEMAYYNMDSRTRIQWSKIWATMSPFFISAMCHKNRDVSMYSIDALRQLTSKFLDKEELSNFSFQRAFLKPFETCFLKSKSSHARELVLTCISQIVLARASNIRSGWKSVFGVLALAADDKVDAIMNFGWQIVDSITRKYVGEIDDVFIDAITGISAYARAKSSTAISIAAIEMLSTKCAQSLASGEALSVLREQSNSKDSPKDVSDAGRDIYFSAEVDAHIGTWFPLLTGLAGSMQDERPHIRMAASNALYKVLTEHGGHFSSSLWALIFRGVLSPVFDDVRYLASSGDSLEAATIGEWATTTGSASLKSLVDVVVKHISVTRILLKDLLGVIRSWILQETEAVAKDGMSLLSRLIMSAGDLLEKDDWAIIVDTITQIFEDTLPHEILSPNGDGKGNSGKSQSENSNNSMEPNGNDTDHQPDSESSKRSTQYANGDDSHDNDMSNGHMANSKVTQENGDLIAEPRKINFGVVRAKCVVQLLLIQLIQEVVVTFYRTLSTEHILTVNASLEASYSVAHKFNNAIELRKSLWRAGFMNILPNLYQQETKGLTSYLRISFWLYLDPERTENGRVTEEKLMQLCENVLTNYINACDAAQSKSDDAEREVASLSPVVSFIISGIMQMSDEQFQRHLSDLYTILLNLLDSADSSTVRQSVTKLFRARIKPESLISNDDTNRKNLEYGLVGKPQLPGGLRERIIRTKIVGESESQATHEIVAALNRVGSVRSVAAIGDAADAFRVISCAPDEMLISSITSLSCVKATFVEDSNDVRLD